MKQKNQFIIRTAVIAAVYALLTIVWPLSFGPVQVRVSEALCVLPILTPAAVPGLFLGCLISGILTGSVWVDVIVGSLTTLVSAALTRKLMNRGKIFRLLPPVILNAVFTGTVVHFCYSGNPTLALWPVTMLTVGAGEAVSVLLLGSGLLTLLMRLPADMWR